MKRRALNAKLWKILTFISPSSKYKESSIYVDVLRVNVGLTKYDIEDNFNNTWNS